jgi:hypothetical protein
VILVDYGLGCTAEQLGAPEARSDTEPAGSHSETVQAAVNIYSALLSAECQAATGSTPSSQPSMSPRFGLLAGQHFDRMWSASLGMVPPGSTPGSPSLKVIGCQWFDVGWWWPPAYSLSQS